MQRSWKILAFALMTSGAVAALAASGATEPAKEDPDRRLVLKLPPDERDMVLAEMRRFVISMQQITAGLAQEDYENVAAAARRMGSAAANEIPPRVVNKLPEEFKQLAGKVHRTFDVIALDAEAMGDTQLALEQVGTLMQHCVACHAIYQIEKVPFPKQ